MPSVELVAFAFVAVAFVAIAARFAPRDERGARQLPRVVDESIGMYAVRQALRVSTEATEVTGATASGLEPEPDEVEPIVEPTLEQIVQRIGVPPPVIPAVLMAVQEPEEPAAVGQRRVAGSDTVDGRPPPSALETQRRLAAVAALAILVVAVVAGATFPRAVDGAVLGVTGTPAVGTPAGGTSAPDLPVASPDPAPQAP